MTNLSQMDAKRWNSGLILGLGALLAALGRLMAQDRINPWSDLLVGHGTILAIIGLGLLAAGDRARHGGNVEWRRRALGAGLAVTLAMGWRAAIASIVSGAGGRGHRGIGVTMASAALLAPALICWAYVATTFVPWSGPGPAHRRGTVERRPQRSAA